MSKSIRPLLNQVMIRPCPEDTQTKSGIIFPDDISRPIPQEGIVVAVGHGIIEVETGDQVIYSKYTGTVMKIDDVEYIILPEKAILAVLEGGENEL